MRVLHVRLQRVLACVLLGAVLLYALHALGRLLHRYGSLFYVETYLPSPPLPPQTRGQALPPHRPPLHAGLPQPHPPVGLPSHARLPPANRGQPAPDAVLTGRVSASHHDNFSQKSPPKASSKSSHETPETLGSKTPPGPQSPQGSGQHGTATRFRNETVTDTHHGPHTPARVLCLIVTSPGYHDTRAVHVRNTWAAHCDRAVFLSSEAGPQLGEVVVVPQAADYSQLWQKVVAGLEWAAEHEHEFEWLVKVDDDSFLLVENLRHMLHGLAPDQLCATGLFLKDWDTEETYLNGGAGYVLSRAGVRAVAGEVQPGGRCTQEGGMTVTDAEDLNMAACFRALGVRLLDSRDDEGHQRFNVYPPHNVIDPRRDTDWAHLWLKKISVFPYKFGFAEMSSDVISFHYVDAESMYLLYYLIYIVNPRVGGPVLDGTWGGDAARGGGHDTQLPNNRRRRSSPTDLYNLTRQQGARAQSHKLELSPLKNFNNGNQNDKKYYGVVQSKYHFPSRDLHENSGVVLDSSYPKPDLEAIGPRPRGRDSAARARS